MADIGSTATFVVYMTFSTDSGDLPEREDMEQLIVDQMAGELDDNGLACLAVSIGGITGD